MHISALFETYLNLHYSQTIMRLYTRYDAFETYLNLHYAETVRYIENLRSCGIPAEIDVYHSDMHTLDMMRPNGPLSRQAALRFNKRFAYAQVHYFAPQKSVG